LPASSALNGTACTEGPGTEGFMSDRQLIGRMTRSLAEIPHTQRYSTRS
jgi:hypothetical protein